VPPKGYERREVSHPTSPCSGDMEKNTIKLKILKNRDINKPNKQHRLKPIANY